MRIRMICPAPPGSLYGNRVTAHRWARILRGLGHRIAIAQQYHAEPCDLLIALHARKSAEAVFRSRDIAPGRPVIVALTGTDLYQDIRHDAGAQRALELATRLVALQPLAIDELPVRLRPKVRVIHQSVEKTQGRLRAGPFDVCVAGHLREVKDPFRAALAVRDLPASSRIRVLHVGGAMTEPMAAEARNEQRVNSRYRWLGPMARARVRRLIASSRLMVLSSLMEGGANVVSEAVVDGVPILASRIPGSIGLLGADYPGYFAAGHTRELTDLLLRAESDAGFYRELKKRCSRLAPLFRPSRERAAWKKLLSAIA